jgi:DNA-binding NtrC family response regulator
MRDLYAQIERAAAAPVDVLVRGETGTGKELIARELHRLSPRAAAVRRREHGRRRRVAGRVRAVRARQGAFTGAAADRKGVFEQADGGTLFLDEIGDMPRPAQTKILRALQERTGAAGRVEPPGAGGRAGRVGHPPGPDPGDRRRPLPAGPVLPDQGGRADRSRRCGAGREDVVLLANYFLDRVGAHRPAGGPAAPTAAVPRRFAPDAVDALLAHPWPGNVRELEQAVTAAAAMAASAEVRAIDLGLPSAAADGGGVRPA